MDKKRKTEEDKLIKSQRRFEEDKQRRFRKSLTFFRFPETKYEDALFATWNHDLKYGIHELWFSDWRPSAISRPLDKIEEQVLRNLFNEWSQSKNKQQVVKYFYDFERLFWDLSSDHFVRLVKEDGWLQSETIIFFMFLLETLAKKKGDENVIFFSSEFFDQLVGVAKEKYNHERIRRRFDKGKIELFQSRLIFISILVNGNHWVQAVVNVEDSVVEILDSMSSSSNTHEDVFDQIVNFLEAEANYKKIEKKEWKFKPTDTTLIPQQTNGSDCGVFVCLYALYKLLDLPMTFSKDDIPKFRKRIALWLFHFDIEEDTLHL